MHIFNTHEVAKKTSRSKQVDHGGADHIYIYICIRPGIYIYIWYPPPQKKNTPQENLTVFAVLLCDFRPFNFDSFQALQL